MIELIYSNPVFTILGCIVVGIVAKIIKMVDL